MSYEAALLILKTVLLSAPPVSPPPWINRLASNVLLMLVAEAQEPEQKHARLLKAWDWISIQPPSLGQGESQSGTKSQDTWPEVYAYRGGGLGPTCHLTTYTKVLVLKIRFCMIILCVYLINT